MNNTIFIFPGQGTQYIGMGKDLFQNFLAAKQAFEEVSDISKIDIRKICFDGPENLLNKPENTSLGIFAHSFAVGKILETEMKKPLYSASYAMTGHSLGQYSALYYAGSLTIKDVINLLEKRSYYMSLINQEGGMVGVVGLSKKQIEEVVSISNKAGYLEISNHNAKDQFVVSGQNQALDLLIKTSKEFGAKTAKRLNVSIPGHSYLMKDGELLLRKHLCNIDMIAPKTKWFSNHTADLVEDPDDIKESLALQMTNGVRWAETMDKFLEHSIVKAYEIGPGQTLSKLINRSDVNCSAIHTNNFMNVKKILDEWQKAK